MGKSSIEKQLSTMKTVIRKVKRNEWNVQQLFYFDKGDYAKDYGSCIFKAEALFCYYCVFSEK